MSIKDKVKGNPALKKFCALAAHPNRRGKGHVYGLKWFVNPIVHKKGRGATIKWRTRIDVLPFNKFNMGRNTVIEDFSTINNGVGDVIIGDDTLIGMSNVLIGPVTIGNNVIFAQNIVASGLNHEYSDVSIPISKQKIFGITDSC